MQIDLARSFPAQNSVPPKAIYAESSLWNAAHSMLPSPVQPEVYEKKYLLALSCVTSKSPFLGTSGNEMGSQIRS